MTWFARNHAGRDLQPYEHAFLEALRELLVELQAPQIDEAETALTSEGPGCLIVLIPHRALGGVSIVVWLSDDRAVVSWAQVSGLGRCHDSLDVGLGVGRFMLDGADPDFGPVLECIRSQIESPLILRCTGTDRATVLVRHPSTGYRKVGQIGRIDGWSALLRSLMPSRDVVIHLTDSDPPPVASPSDVGRWFE